MQHRRSTQSTYTAVYVLYSYTHYIHIRVCTYNIYICTQAYPHLPTDVYNVCCYADERACSVYTGVMTPLNGYQPQYASFYHHYCIIIVILYPCDVEYIVYQITYRRCAVHALSGYALFMKCVLLALAEVARVARWVSGKINTTFNIYIALFVFTPHRAIILLLFTGARAHTHTDTFINIIYSIEVK